MSQYLSEAFKRLDTLNEDTFAISDNGLEDFVKFEEEDAFEDSIDVIDPEAETIEDLQDSYVGKVILDCCVCHSKIYKDVEDVVIEDDIANANEECPFCYTTDGYKVIGQVATFGEEEVEEKTETENDTKEDKEEKELEESLPSRTSRRKRVREFLPTPPMPNVGGLLEDEEDKDLDEFMDANITLDARGFGGKDNNVSVLGGKLPLGKDEDLEEGIFGNKEKSSEFKNAMSDFNLEVEKITKDKSLDDIAYALTTSLRASISAYKRFADKDNKDTRYTDTNNIYENKGNQILQIYASVVKAVKKPTNFYSPYIVITNAIDKILEDYAGKSDILRRLEPYANMLNDIAQINADKNIKITALKEFYEVIQYSLSNDYSELRKGNPVTLFESIESKSIKESVNNVNVETDEDVINVATDDNGKVTVTTEPKTTENTMEDAEVITPVEPEVQSEISDNVEDGGEIEIDMDEFDEESFDELGEGYLKKVYENVNSFKTSSVSFIKDKLILEGVINFTSGKSKKTNFVFGIREATKSGKVRFIGENKEIARGRKSFTITGRVDNKKFLSESLNYNYGVKGANGKSQRLYGTIKRGK